MLFLPLPPILQQLPESIGFIDELSLPTFGHLQQSSRLTNMKRSLRLMSRRFSVRPSA